MHRNKSCSITPPASASGEGTGGTDRGHSSRRRTAGMLAHAAHPGSARPRRGSRTVNSVKSPTSLSTVSVPPCCWVMIS